MTTRTVGGTVVGANGVPIASAPIVIELVLAEAFVVTGSYSMGGTLRLQTAADGTWSTPLQCNDDLTPVGTLYQVTEKIPSSYGGAKCYLIQVLTVLGGGVNQVGALLVPAAVPVGGTYNPIAAIGPPGIQGTPGTNGQGVPTGGSTGQILAKTSATDYATAWTSPAPLGTMGYVQNTTQPVLGSGVSDVPGLSLSITTLAGRRYKFTIDGYGCTQTGAGFVQLQLLSGAAAIKIGVISRVAADTAWPIHMILVYVPGAATTTYKVQTQVAGGATGVTLYSAANYPLSLLVEDIGT